MIYNFENNNSKKKRAEEKNIYPIVAKKRPNNYRTQRRLKNGGFVGWAGK
jgi:hypothetical protein